jgi:hypothetical protein
MFNFLKRIAASIQNPAADRKILFLDDADDKLKIKDSNGNLEVLSTSASNGLRSDSGNNVLGSDDDTDPKGSELTSDTYIHLDGNDFSFVGSSGYVLTVDSANTLNLTTPDLDGTTTQKYLWKYQALADKDVSFNFITSTTNVGSGVNNDVFMMGWNLHGGGGNETTGKSAIGLSFENNYEPSVGFDIAEKHLFFIDKAGTQHRLESYTINKDDPDTWEKYNTLNKSYLKKPNSYTWHQLVQNPGGDVIEDFASADKTLRFLVQPSQNRFNITPIGFDATLHANTIDFSGFGIIKNSAYEIIVYPSELIIKLSKHLNVHADNAAALAGGRQVRELYRDNNGFIKVVV